MFDNYDQIKKWIDTYTGPQSQYQQLQPPTAYGGGGASSGTTTGGGLVWDDNTALKAPYLQNQPYISYPPIGMRDLLARRLNEILSKEINPEDKDALASEVMRLRATLCVLIKELGEATIDFQGQAQTVGSTMALMDKLQKVIELGTKANQ